jgi:hypothetical protein
MASKETLMMNMDMDMEMEMQMTFYSDPHFEFLFDSWHVDSKGKYIGSLFGLFFFAIGISILNYLLIVVEKKHSQ